MRGNIGNRSGASHGKTTNEAEQNRVTPTKRVVSMCANEAKETTLGVKD